MTRDFRPPWTASFSVGMALRSSTTRPSETWPVAAWYRPQSPGQRGSGICEIGPAKLPSYLFFEFMKARERRRAAWNLSRLICQPLRQIDVIIVHDVQPRFPGKLAMVFSEHAVHLGDLFMDIKAFCNHVLCSRRCRQPPLERDDFSWNRHPALSFCLSMISAQTLRVCREGKPVPTFPDHALGFRGSPQLRINDSARVGSISKNAGFLHR